MIIMMNEGRYFKRRIFYREKTKVVSPEVRKHVKHFLEKCMVLESRSSFRWLFAHKENSENLLLRSGEMKGEHWLFDRCVEGLFPFLLMLIVEKDISFSLNRNTVYFLELYVSNFDITSFSVEWESITEDCELKDEIY